MRSVLKRVIGEECNEERKTEGGIVLPDCHTKDQMKFKIISKGKDVTDEIKVGDVVLVSGFQGHKINDTTRVFEQDQILAVIDA